MKKKKTYEESIQDAASSNDCWIQVVQLSSKAGDININLGKTQTIAELKQKIQAENKQDAVQMKLIFKAKDSTDKGVTLKDTQTAADILEKHGEPHSGRIQLVLDISGGGPAKREADSKEKHTADVQDKFDLCMMRCAALQHVASNTVQAHITQMVAGIDAADEAPMQKVIESLPLAEVRKLQNVVGTTGREETRIKAIVNVIFAQDSAVADHLEKVAGTMKDSMNTFLKKLFYQTYMTDNGDIKWNLFTKAINKRIDDLTNQAALLALAQQREHLQQEAAAERAAAAGHL